MKIQQIKIMPTEKRVKKIKTVIQHRQPDLTVVLENIHDPHNVSAILRSCDAVGVHEVQLVYTTEEFPQIGKKSSASAKKWIRLRKHKSIDECYKYLRKNGFFIYATKIQDGSPTLYDLDLKRKIAFVFGNEHRGVSDEAAKKADAVFMIPMFGMIESLNVSVACGVTLFECLRQRLVDGGYNTSKFTEAEINQLLNEWAKK